MALTRLTTEEMVELSSTWVREGSPARAALLAIDGVAGLMPRLDEAHADLTDAQPDDEEPRLAELMATAAEVDLRHDSVIGGMDTLPGGLILWLGGTPKAASLSKLLEVLLPSGLQATQLTFRAEAGAGANGRGPASAALARHATNAETA